MAKIKKILLVCTGNSCRSIMAEGLLKKALKDLGKNNIEVTSAGVNAIDGIAPTRETIEAMKKEGIDVSGFRSKRLTDKDIYDADLILVMAVHHIADIVKSSPEAAPKIHLLKRFGLSEDEHTSEDMDISDPIGMPSDFYECTMDSIKQEVERIARLLQ